jgi:hypothetical protein
MLRIRSYLARSQLNSSVSQQYTSLMGRIDAPLCGTQSTSSRLSAPLFRTRQALQLA